MQVVADGSGEEDGPGGFDVKNRQWCRRDLKRRKSCVKWRGGNPMDRGQQGKEEGEW